ncbi:MAG: asparagine synthase (glutamine-hydrolyzing) [Candidatus Rokubacteria bacterium]|nr:asparagine synthase (glutamine-hydrolyzing) [Candidatus Rokubacteria bacterium]
MCGICGLANLDGAPIPRLSLDGMAATIRHRGPDSQGIHVDDAGAPGRMAVGIASTRLKIIDLSERARQPLSNEDDSVWIVFNGEIYNYPTLAAELRARGHRFKSESDTEVVLHLYEERGEACVEALDGMFAFALWDRARGRLLLARDRAGKKPLFYTTAGRTLCFASEIKALLRHPGVSGEVDPAALPPYLLFGYVPAPDTFYRDVKSVPAGCTLTVEGGTAPRIRSYWDLRFPASPAPVAPAEARATVRELVTEAVRKRLISDVPLGAFLSGGIDSSIVVGLMSRLSSERVKTFSIGFRGAPAYDETRHARAVAERFGTEHTEFLVEQEAADLVEPLVWHHDGPFRDSSAIPTFILSRLAREHVTVVLNGDGGDELFAGYTRFRAALLAERLPRAAFRAADALLARASSSTDGRGAFGRLRRFVHGGARPLWERFTEGFAAADVPLALLRPEVFEAAGPYTRLRYLAPHVERARGLGPLSRLLYVNFKSYLLDDLLVKADRCTMAHGLEARSPFLDRALTEYVAGLPDALKLHGRTSKVVLKAAFGDLLPPGIERRGKMGFGVPMAAWLRTNLKKVVHDVLLQPRPRLADYLDAAGVRALATAHLEGRADHGALLWSLLTLETWLGQLPSWRAKDPA